MFKTRFIEQMAFQIEAFTEHRGGLCVVFRGAKVDFTRVCTIIAGILSEKNP